MFFLVFAMFAAPFGLHAITLKTVTATDILPTAAAQLEGAIVSAAEQDAEEQEIEMDEDVNVLKFGQQMLDLAWQQLSVSPNNAHYISNDFENLLQNIDEGRGRLRKRRRMLKYLYTFVVGLLIAKSVVLPLILKMLMALSSASFVMSKIALMTSGLLAIRWLFSAGDAYESGSRRAKVEVIHLPAAAAAGKPYIGGSRGNWANDLKWSAGSFGGRDHQYIPLGGFNNRHTHNNYHPIAANEGQPFL